MLTISLQKNYELWFQGYVCIVDNYVILLIIVMLVNIFSHNVIFESVLAILLRELPSEYITSSKNISDLASSNHILTTARMK